jgi:hypothetical protein
MVGPEGACAQAVAIAISAGSAPQGHWEGARCGFEGCDMFATLQRDFGK